MGLRAERGTGNARPAAAQMAAEESDGYAVRRGALGAGRVIKHPFLGHTAQNGTKRGTQANKTTTVHVNALFGRASHGSPQTQDCGLVVCWAAR